MNKNTPFGLSPREIDVWNATLDGARNKVVGSRIFITERSVKWHLANIFQKCGVSSRAELMKLQFKFNCKWLEGGKNRINVKATPHHPEHQKKVAA